MTPEPGMDVDRTCKHAVLAVTPEYLMTALGDPHHRRGGVGWMFRDSLGQRWTIYDHKGSADHGLLSLGGEFDKAVDSRLVRAFVESKLPEARLIWVADARGGLSSSLMEKYIEFLTTRRAS